MTLKYFKKCIFSCKLKLSTLYPPLKVHTFYYPKTRQKKSLKFQIKLFNDYSTKLGTFMQYNENIKLLKFAIFFFITFETHKKEVSDLLGAIWNLQCLNLLSYFIKTFFLPSDALFILLNTFTFEANRYESRVI